MTVTVSLPDAVTVVIRESGERLLMTTRPGPPGLCTLEGPGCAERLLITIRPGPPGLCTLEIQGCSLDFGRYLCIEYGRRECVGRRQVGVTVILVVEVESFERW